MSLSNCNMLLLPDDDDESPDRVLKASHNDAIPLFKEIQGYSKVKAKLMGLFKNYSLHNKHQYSFG